MSKLAAVFGTLNAEAHRKASDEAQELADELRSWPMFPRTPEKKAEAEMKRDAWKQAQAEVEGMRRRERIAAYYAASALLKANRQSRRGK